MPPQLPAAGIGVGAELAAKLAAKRSQVSERGSHGGDDLVDGVAKGMANGVRVRAMSRERLPVQQRPVLRPPPGAAGGNGSGQMYPPAAAPLPADGNKLRADSSSRTGMRRESWLVAEHI